MVRWLVKDAGGSVVNLVIVLDVLLFVLLIFLLYLLSVCLSYFLRWGGTRSLRMSALRPASQAGPMRSPRDKTSVV